MNNLILIGTKIKTAKGTEGTITQILEGGYLLDNGKRVRGESVASVIPPPEPTRPLAVGDTVYYCGDRYWEQYRDTPLVLLELRAGSGWTARKPDGYYTTNLETRELSRSPVKRPKVNGSKISRECRWLKGWESEQRQERLIVNSIETGDRLRRNPRPPKIEAIESATVEKFSPDGYWVSTPEGKTYHVSESSIEAGDWELIERNYQ